MTLVISDLITDGQQIEYQAAWDAQRTLHAGVVARTEYDTIQLLEHSSVYTAGRRTEPFDRPVDGTPVVEVDRGGKITWHGPGQIVGYPIVHLPSAMDVVPHVRRLEDVIIAVCEQFGIAGTRIKGRSGVWVLGENGQMDRKIAAIGVRVAQGVTMHGFALNCNNDLNWFHKIVPCGIRDAEVTTLSEELGRDVTIHEALPIVKEHLVRIFGPLAAEHGATDLSHSPHHTPEVALS